MSHPWLQTYPENKAFDLLEPQPASVNAHDIANHLAHICRYTGGVPIHYSVAQHSVLVARALEAEAQSTDIVFTGLMHDAPEAYVNDMSSPAKRAMRQIARELYGTDAVSPYDVLERRAWACIVARFPSLPLDLPEAVKVADLRMLATEKRWLGKEAKPWELKHAPYDIVITPWTADEAASAFLSEFGRLVMP